MRLLDCCVTFTCHFRHRRSLNRHRLCMGTDRPCCCDVLCPPPAWVAAGWQLQPRGPATLRGGAAGLTRCPLLYRRTCAAGWQPLQCDAPRRVGVFPGKPGLLWSTWGGHVVRASRVFVSLKHHRQEGFSAFALPPGSDWDPRFRPREADAAPSTASPGWACQQPATEWARMVLLRVLPAHAQPTLCLVTSSTLQPLPQILSLSLAGNALSGPAFPPS